MPVHFAHMAMLLGRHREMRCMGVVGRSGIVAMGLGVAAVQPTRCRLIAARYQVARFLPDGSVRFARPQFGDRGPQLMWRPARRSRAALAGAVVVGSRRQKTEYRGQMADDTGHRTEDRGGRTEDTG